MKQILGDEEKLSNETNSNEISNQIPVPRIEKPTIRIDMGIKLNEIDDHVGSIAGKLLPDVIDFNERIELIDLFPVELQSLREEYLKVDDISPVFDSTSDKKLSLVYPTNKDLTMRELDDLLTSVTNKLHTVITLDLKKDISQSIRRISIYGSRERARQDVLDILSAITNFINEYAIAYKLSDALAEFIPKYGWEKDIGLTYAIAEKLDEVYSFDYRSRNLAEEK